jgi:HAD superfamily hydrolase (TIGR01459 family)
MSLRLLSGLHEIAASYDGFILDLWGVLHDGSVPYPGVVDALQRLKAQGKRLVILSNAPRRADAVIERMTEIGIVPGLYDAVHSSGEEAWQHMKRRDDPFYAALGRRCYHIGPTRDHNMLEGIDLEPVETVEIADFLLNTGPWDWNDTVADFEPTLKAARHRDLPMVCANADLVVMHQGHLMICAGALAKRYEEMGGMVRWHGKPFPSVYAACFERLGIADRRRIVAVGDSLRTDIAGANAAGIDSLLVTGGIHAEEFEIAGPARPDPAAIHHAAGRHGSLPTAILPRFAW